MPDRSSLPIDPWLGAIVGAQNKNIIVSATPGSGKTTRIPPAFLASRRDGGDGRILCVQPKRIACIAAAKRVAAENNETLGGAVGYHVRLDKKTSENTRLVFVTTGILLRYLCSDPFLENVSHVIFDEFHERSLENDLAFAMVRTLQEACRDDLRITVMSATIDADPVEQFLAPCSVFKIDAPIHPLAVRYAPIRPDKRFSVYISPLIDAVKTAIAETDGDCLVFLPGVGEIQEAVNIAAPVFPDCAICACHASLPIARQAQILSLPSDRKRRIIFSTNVAESSLTVPGVKAVVDSGLVKQKFFDTFSGLSRLETQWISRASADQRAGRAARIAPGLCIRLWPQSMQNALNAQTIPEIERLDLSQAILQICAWGLQAPESLRFLSQPAPNRIAEAKKLLRKLGALKPAATNTPSRRRYDNSGDAESAAEYINIDIHGNADNISSDCAGKTPGNIINQDIANQDIANQDIANQDIANQDISNEAPDIITPLGRQMAAIPLEPRLARWMLEAADLDIIPEAALLAAFLSETPYRRNQKNEWSKPNLCDDFFELKKNIRKPEFAQLKRIADDIAKAAENIPLRSKQGDQNISDRPLHNMARIGIKDALAKSMLPAYADRLAQQRTAKKDASVPKDDPRRDTIPVFACMSGNHGVTISAPYDLKDETFFLCADVDLVRGIERASSRVVKAFPVDPKLIPWEQKRIARYEPDKDRVVVADALVYDCFILRETFLRGGDIRPIIRQTLIDAARRNLPKALNFSADAWIQFKARCDFAKKCQPYNDIPEFNANWFARILPKIVGNAASFAELRAADLSQIAAKSLSQSAKSILQTYAPERATLPNGYETAVDYTLSPPVIRVKIQKAFGAYALPKVGAGTIPVLIHLCAPNGRPVQMTQDLPNFWRSTYADVRKLLRGRYPKHDWPEIPPPPIPEKKK